MEKVGFSFSKLHGNGNDYVYMEKINTELPDLSTLAMKVSNRSFGIGSDGLIVADVSQVADLRMHMYNADGSRGKMCGNGIRCLAKYAYDNGLVSKTNMSIETDAGIKYVSLRYNPSDAVARVDMGMPCFDPKLIPALTDASIDYMAEAFEPAFRLSSISMGNPHSVSFADELPPELFAKYYKNEVVGFDSRIISLFNDMDTLERLSRFDIESFGRLVQESGYYPEGVNVEIADVIDEKTLAMRVYERGSGETLSCGTGCCAVAVAAIKKGYASDAVRVHTLGGWLDIEWDGCDTSSVYMTGSARTVFEGRLPADF